MSGQRSIGKDDDEWPACYDGVQDTGSSLYRPFSAFTQYFTACPNMTGHVQVLPVASKTCRGEASP